MLSPRIVDVVAGSTIKLTWSNSGASVSGISSSLLNNVESVVTSAAGVSSGNGFYYANMLVPNSDAWYVNEWFATINANTYVSRQLIHAHKLRVNSL